MKVQSSIARHGLVDFCKNSEDDYPTDVTNKSSKSISDPYMPVRSLTSVSKGPNPSKLLKHFINPEQLQAGVIPGM